MTERLKQQTIFTITFYHFRAAFFKPTLYYKKCVLFHHWLIYPD